MPVQGRFCCRSRLSGTEEARAAAKASGILPLDHMLAVMRDPTADVKRRDAMAAAAAPYLHAKLSPVESQSPLPILGSRKPIRLRSCLSGQITTDRMMSNDPTGPPCRRRAALVSGRGSWCDQAGRSAVRDQFPAKANALHQRRIFSRRPLTTARAVSAGANRLVRLK